MLRSQGTLDSGGSQMRLTLTEVPPQSVVRLLAAPASGSGWSFGLGCLPGAAVQVLEGPLLADPHGACTWWAGGSSAAAALVAGTSWTFQVHAWNAGQEIQSNALEVHFR